MELQDKVLKCIDCEADFVFTVGEQRFFRDRQFMNEPRRCKDCKRRVRSTSFTNAPAVHKSPRIETHATCSHCGKNTTVPFVPTQGRPVLCRECFQGGRTTASA